MEESEELCGVIDSLQTLLKLLKTSHAVVSIVFSEALPRLHQPLKSPISTLQLFESSDIAFTNSCLSNPQKFVYNWQSTGQ